MFAIIRLANSVFQTYLQSLMKDLGKGVFESILIIALLSWVDLLVALGLWASGMFQMPSDLWFYVFWFLLTLSTEITFTAFLLGILSSTLMAANSFENAGFIMTPLFAVIFLHESYGWLQAAAIAVAFIGALLFFERDSTMKGFISANKGLLLIVFSLVLAPLEYIFYKSATLHTASYHQFLTGRLVMDAAFYTLFFVCVVIFWYRKNPFPLMKAKALSKPGILFLAGTTIAELVESWLVFKMPIGLFMMLGVISIPVGYFIGWARYGDTIKKKEIIGGILVAVAVAMFIV